MNKNTLEHTLDLDANHYVNHSSLQNSLAIKIINTYQFNPSAYILDVGCGDGRITAELAIRANKGKVLGIDPSPSMIEFASKNFPKTKFDNLDFLQGMAEAVHIPHEFDLIVSFSCFHWLKDPKTAVSRLSSALKQGGEMLILTYPKESPYYRYLEIALKNYPEYFHLSANHNMLSSIEYEELLMSNNLEILEFQQQDLVASYNDSKELQEYIKGWLNCYVPLPVNLYDSFLQEVSKVVLSDPNISANGKISIPYTALIIRARK